jgi:hypothetical protein
LLVSTAEERASWTDQECGEAALLLEGAVGREKAVSVAEVVDGLTRKGFGFQEMMGNFAGLPGPMVEMFERVIEGYRRASLRVTMEENIKNN